MKNKKMIAAGLIAAFGLAVLTSSQVFAQSDPNENRMNTIVARIAQKFDLNESDVQAVFEAERKDRQTEMQKRFADRLADLVTQGKLTENQKTLLLEKHKEIQAKKQGSRGEFAKWAKDNGIELENLMPFVRGFGHHGMMR